MTNGKKTRNDEDFHILSLEDDTLIEQVPGLDDEEEFFKDMEDLGDYDDLPDSDKAMIRKDKK